MICGVLKKDGKECQMKVTSTKGCRYHSSGVAKKKGAKKEVFLVYEEIQDWYDAVLAVYGSLKDAEKKLLEVISEQEEQEGHKEFKKRQNLSPNVKKDGVVSLWEHRNMLFYIRKMEVL